MGATTLCPHYFIYTRVLRALRQLLFNLCSEAREKGWRNRVHTNVGVLCTAERANAVKAPSSLKGKATDFALSFEDVQ